MPKGRRHTLSSTASHFTDGLVLLAWNKREQTITPQLPENRGGLYRLEIDIVTCITSRMGVQH